MIWNNMICDIHLPYTYVTIPYHSPFPGVPFITGYPQGPDPPRSLCYGGDLASRRAGCFLSAPCGVGARWGPGGGPDHRCKSSDIFRTCWHDSSWLTGNHAEVSWNRGTPKSSILIGFSNINHPFGGTPIYGNPHMNPAETNLPVRIRTIPCQNQLLTISLVPSYFPWAIPSFFGGERTNKKT